MELTEPKHTLIAMCSMQVNRLLKTPQLAIAHIAFLAAVFVLFAILWGQPASQFRLSFPLFVTITIFIAAAFSLPGLFNEDLKNGIIEFLQSSKSPLEKYVASISLSYNLVLILPSIIIAGVLLLLSGLPIFETITILTMITICAAIVVSLTVLTAAFCSDAEGRGSMVGFLSFPLIIPAFLIMDAFVQQFSQGPFHVAYLLFLLGLLLISLGLSIVSAAYGLRLALQ